MWKLFSRNETVQEDQQRLFFALEKIVNIALVKTERGDNQSVKRILEDLEQTFRKFWRLKKDNPDKFKSLLWSKDFFERYVVPLSKQKNLIKDDLQQAKSADNLVKEAAFLLSFDARRELKGLTLFLNSFEKIWECAFRNDNEEISRYVVYHLIWMLDELTREPSNDLFVEQFLILLNSIAKKAIRRSKQEKEMNISAYSAAIHWYTNIAFSIRRNFDLSYLDLFDKYFFSTVKYIISENQTSLFHALISSLVDGIHIPTYHRGKIWNYGQLILHSNSQKYIELDTKFGIQSHIEELANSESTLYTKERLYEWLKKFDELKGILQPHFDEKQKEEANKIEEEIKEFAVSQFKYNNLLEIVFAIGAYCLFKKKPEYIKYFWEYKQPPDSDASWMGLDIVPNTLDSVVGFYFSRGMLERKSLIYTHFWEGHHGSELYYKQYFLLLLARILQNINYKTIKNYNLPDLNIYHVADLEGSIRSFIDVAKELKKHENVLNTLDFDTNNLEELFDNKLIPFLQTLKTKAQERIKDIGKTQKINPKRVAEFKEKVAKAFNKSIILRDVFKHYHLYEDKTKEKYKGELQRFGLNFVDLKSAFFEEWHVHFVNWGISYGRDLAFGENSYLLDKIIENCIEIKEGEFEEKLSNFKDLSDVIIFATNVALYRFFENSKNFKPKWYKEITQLDVNGFAGWYEFKGQSIPIFKTFHRNRANQILILNKSKLGRLIQYSPLNEGEDEGLLKDIFYVNVQAFSEDSGLLDSFLKKPPEWLQKIGDEKKQKEYLLERVLIHIFERFEYDKPEKFEGYLLRLKD